MGYILAVVILLLILVTVKYVNYRRQVKDICRQLSFIINEKSNYRLRTEIGEKEITELANLLNELNDAYIKKGIAMQQKDERLKDTLVNLSHDIRTPLTSLKGYFRLLMQEESHERQIKYAEIMSERMDNLADLLEELFTYTKLQNDAYVLDLETQDMTSLVLDTLFSFYEEFNKRGLIPNLRVEETLYYVNCNEVAVKRVLSNIIKNAFIHGSDNIEISYTHSAKEGAACCSNVVFVCENTVSHPEEIDLSQIFDRFYKADKARSRNSTGLGLAIAKELVRKMDGEIDAELYGDRFKITVSFPVIECSDREISKEEILMLS